MLKLFGERLTRALQKLIKKKVKKRIRLDSNSAVNPDDLKGPLQTVYFSCQGKISLLLSFLFNDGPQNINMVQRLEFYDEKFIYPTVSLSPVKWKPSLSLRYQVSS